MEDVLRMLLFVQLLTNFFKIYRIFSTTFSRMICDYKRITRVVATWIEIEKIIKRGRTRLRNVTGINFASYTLKHCSIMDEAQ